MLLKKITYLLFTLHSLICTSQNQLAKNFKKYDNCFFGKVIDLNESAFFEGKRKDCFINDTITVQIIENINGNNSLDKDTVKIPYQLPDPFCIGTYGKFFNINEKHLFFFDDLKSINKNDDFYNHEVKSKNEEKQLKLVYKYLKANSDTKIIDWALDYANEISYKDGLMELFQYKHKAYKWYFLICENHICNCENSYTLNKKQIEKLKVIYIKQKDFSVFDICVLTEINDYSDEKLFEATKKRFQNITDKNIHTINKPLIQCTTKFSNDPKLIKISTRIEKFKYQDYPNGYKAFKLLVKEYIEHYPK